MSSVVTQLKPERKLYQGIATVSDVEADFITVGTEYGDFPARQAISCLVRPEKGDRIIVAGMLDGDLYVTDVLERPDDAPTRISLKGNCSIKVDHGKLDLAAQEGIHLLSPKELGFDGSRITMRASRFNAAIGRLTYIGSQIFAQSKKIRLVGILFDSVMDRVAQRFKSSYRTVEEVDQVRSKEIDYRADKNLRLSGQNALIDADDLVRVDGDQIHLG